MEYGISILFLGTCIVGMAIGLILKKKVLKRGCTLDPDAGPDDSCSVCGKTKSTCDK